MPVQIPVPLDFPVRWETPADAALRPSPQVRITQINGYLYRYEVKPDPEAVKAWEERLTGPPPHRWLAGRRRCCRT